MFYGEVRTHLHSHLLYNSNYLLILGLSQGNAQGDSHKLQKEMIRASNQTQNLFHSKPNSNPCIISGVCKNIMTISNRVGK